MKTIRLIFLPLGILLFSFLSSGQKTEFYVDIQNQIQVAKELFNQSKFNASYREFEKIQNLVGNKSEIYSEAEYYKAYASLKSGQANGDKMMNDFIALYPASPYVNKARFNLGVNQFDKQRYSLAIKTLNQVNQSDLDEREKELFHYQLGYAYLNEDDLDKAAAEFFKIKDGDNIFSKPASYYWAHINYLKGNYDLALEGFTKLNGDPTYSQVIPLYVSHIYYKQGRYSEIVDYTSGIIDDVEEAHQPELAKIVGDSYFHLKQFDKAIPFLEKYYKSKGLKSNEDNYLLGYSYYNGGESGKAIPYLEKASKGKDSLAQNAYYHLADCYIKNGEKQKARIAFEAASEMNFDFRIKEDALFNYAKITYEISYSPFSETIKAFDKYISTYPNSERNNSAYQYLVQVYMVTHNYADAINSIEKIMVRNPALNNAYQRVTFYRGLELFNDQDYNGAVKCFEKSLGISTGSRDFVIRSIFWKAEALYRIGDYNSAISEYNRFVLMPGASSILEYQDAQYNLAYAYFKLEDYTTANSFFRKFLNASQGKRTDKIADALNRVGDCYFLARDYTEAVKNYSQSYGMKIYDPDYSLFQIALCEGLERKYEEKITHLRTLLNDYRTSDYRDDALYELGRAYERTAQNSEALALYNDIVTNYKQSSYYKKALVQLGLIYYNNKNNSESLKYYKEVVEKFPNTDEATAALNGIKNNYIDLNNLDTYFEYARQLGKGDISTTEQDALIYQAAEKRFMAGDKDAITQFKRYLNDFPYGAYVLNAHFYLGEALYNNGNYSESKEHYDYVARQSDNIFSEPAVAKMAELTFEARDYENALKLFKRLETLSGSPFNTLKAYAGQMDCNFELKKYQDAVTTAQKVREAEKADDQLLRDADYILAKSYYNLENWELALTGFKKLATETKSAQGAEAKYIVSELLFRKQQLKPAEKEILDFIDKGTPHKFWLGKSFLLLSDIYHASGDDFQAKHTLKSVVENYGDNSDGIVQEASGKLAAIEAKEKSDQDAAKKNPVEIKINNK